MVTKLFLFCFLVFIAVSLAHPKPSCGCNEEYRTGCTEPTCDPKKPIKRYGYGCFCKQGFVRHNGVCIPKNECPCPYSHRSYIPKPSCSCNEEYRTGCSEPTCNPKKPIKRSGYGCFCKQGFVRHNGICIPKHKCPHVCY